MRLRSDRALLGALATVLAACSSTIAPSDAGDATTDGAFDSPRPDVTDIIELQDTLDVFRDVGCTDANTCPTPANGSASCESGVCGFRCDAGFHLCGAMCASDVDVASCGTSCTPCTAPSNAVPSCDGGVCDFMCSLGYERVGDVCVPAPPRPIAPLSTATVTSRRPTLRWLLAPGTDGAHVEICRDRACTSLIASMDAVGASVAPDTDLPAGVVYWRLRGRVGASMGTTYSPTWQCNVGTRTAAHDASWGSVPDVNGDGFADVIVGTYGSTPASGSVYVYAGGPSGITNEPASLLANPDPAYPFGESVASAGDIDGDGFGDVIVGASAGAGPDRVHVYRGGAGGLGATPAMSISGLVGVPEYFGYSLASAGDINGDGYSDVIVGAPGSSGAPGHAYVWLGSASGLDSASTTLLTATGTTSLFASSVAGAGDVDGDGFADVIIGEPNLRRAYVYHGGVAGLDAAPATVLMEPAGSTRSFGYDIACAGDVNADGFADVIVSALMEGGRAYVFLGGPTGLASTPATTILPPAGSNDLFGLAVAGAGDLNADGFADAIVAGYGSGSGSETAVHVYLGGADGLAPVPGVSIAPPEAFDRFGFSVAGAGDSDQDGFADFVVGSVAGSRAYVFSGSSSGVSTTPPILLSGPGEFGFSVATRTRIEWLRDSPAFAVRVPNRARHTFLSSS